ncbi:MAG: DUF1549 domain-containing protein [Prosthecobacter sp.]|uniref:DUF1549 domain-containing protein n=1 Tax=Prosthecobacter sp. TaxID=1965333 RepID=UPI003BAF6B9B
MNKMDEIKGAQEQSISKSSAPSASLPLCGKSERPQRLFIALALSLFFVPLCTHAVSIHASADPVKDEPKITAKDQEHWAFKPLQTTPGKTGIDDLAKPASPPADPATLIRRITFDLTGLPPTPEEVAAFSKACIQHPASRIKHRATSRPPAGFSPLR